MSVTTRPARPPIVPDESTGVTRETPSRRSRAATRSASTGRCHDVASRRTADATRSAAVSGSTSRRCTEATSSASAESSAIARSISPRARAVAAATTSPARLPRRRCSSSPSAASASRRSTIALHSLSMPSPRRASVRTIGGPPGRVGIEGDHSTNVVLQRLRPRLIHLVDRDHVRDLHDPGLQRLHRVSRARHQDEHDLVGDAHHLDLALPRSDGLEEDDVRPGGVEEQEGLERGLGQPAEMPTGAHRADEHARVEEVIGEPDPVAEQRSAREGARGIDRDHPHRQVERANVRDQRTDQRRLADAGRPRDPDREGRAGRRIQLLEHGQGAGVSALDQRDRPRHGSPVARSHAGDELVVSPRAAGHRRHSTARARPFWTADAVRRRL